MTYYPTYSSVKFWDRSQDYIEKSLQDEDLDRQERNLANYRQAQRAINQIGSVIDLEPKLFMNLGTGYLECLPTNELGVAIRNVLISFWTGKESI